MARVLSVPTRSELGGLGELIAALDPASFRDAAHVGAQIHAVIACLGFGALTELDEVPSHLRSTIRAGVPADTREAIAKAEAVATLGAASDLDPLDRGPAHIALPSAVAALVLAQHRGRSSADVVDAVAVGIEVGARLRRCVTSVRPGVGFHSAGTFGLFAAAAACARLLRLDAASAANAIAISLTRAAGLSLNSAMTRIGLTHFGRAAGGAIEAALLAEDGWTASQRLDIAFDTFFGSGADFAPLEAAEYVSAMRPAAFKHYPCNIYLNLAVRALLRSGHTAGPIEVVLPPVRHLDNAHPVDLRELRNSAQGAVAAVSLHAPSYKSFTAKTLRIGANAALTSRPRAITVRIDVERSTSLDSARVDVTTAVGTESSSAEELGSWSADDLVRLRSGFERETRSWAEAPLDADLLRMFDTILRSNGQEQGL